MQAKQSQEKNHRTQKKLDGTICEPSEKLF
jgi:hypothetical protein